MRIFAQCLLVAAAGLSALQADTFDFGCITANSGNCGAIASQMSVEVTDYGSNQVLFTFRNAGPLASSITDVYFDDGTLLGIASVINSTGTEFTQPASPGDLPGGNNVSPAFQTTAGFSADSTSPVQANGVNPGEQVGIVFNLLTGKSFADTLLALTGPLGSGDDLRIGIHVQGLSGGQSESMINFPTPRPPQGQIPEPSSVLLLSTMVGGVIHLLRKRVAA